MIEVVARGIVYVVKLGHRHRAWLSGFAIATTLVIASAYLGFGALRMGSMASRYRVSVQLAESGGLIPNQDVTLRGLRIGKVDSVTPSDEGPVVVVLVESDAKIPASSAVSVSALSAAGEQHLDFEPDGMVGPFLAEGAVVARDRTSTPVSLASMLADADGALAQLDPKKLATIEKELSLSQGAPQKLTDIVDGGVFLLSTLDSVLPETVSLLKNSRVVLSSAADMNSGLADTSARLRRTLGGVRRMDGGYRTLVDQVPEALANVDTLFTDNSDTMVQLLGNLTTVAKLSYLRVPALNALFPSYRGSALERLSGILRDHGVWAIADVYPRYGCDYGTKRLVPSAADYPEPYMYGTYCQDQDPAVLIRGAKNAPRPAGDDTAGPPPGADPAAVTDPTPRGRYTIPTPYGGPTLPIEPPK
ncbi:MCE family protein [Mycobacterium sp. CBMA271]|uniref:MlaD family protein n=1 Tax=unclassified Mycobacteroides TaxID=2618759 RepID=UPI0012DBD4F2|nr:MULTISPECIES: MlaD family protein [unclassified Mycobacteroides]MUM19748.1 mammalian cell entry protein [Mycobacteroides sp. CBMA 326]MUM21096.1 MCE family protein [Mycobacteroides sp. CBMA 271]